MQNGGSATASQLETLDAERYAEVLAWVAGLPLYDVVRAGERDYILTHAGINSADSQAWRADNPEADLSDHAVLENYLAQRMIGLTACTQDGKGTITSQINALKPAGAT